MTFLRLGWHVCLALYIAVQVYTLKMANRNPTWGYIRDMALVVVAMTLVLIIGFIIGVIY